MFFYSMQQQPPFLDQIVTRDEKWILYDGDDQLSGWTLD